jgi:hypothetical protein
MKFKSRLAACSLVAALGASLTYAVARAQEGDADEPKPKHEIAEVMHGAHLPAEEGAKSLRDRVLGGDATPEEKQELLDLYISLAENKPPKGELEAWQAKTGKILVSAAKVVVGREGAEKELEKATNCMACHKDHKPPQEQ